MVNIQSPPPLSRLAPALALAAAALASAIGVPSNARALAVQAADPPGDPEPVVVYLVRHAERAEDGTDDPPLALAGQIRTQVLRHLLAQAGITHVHTTDWKRTRDTARPVAQDLGLEPRIYDAQDLEAFATTLGGTPGRHLVVGHSNTTPQLVEALGGGPPDPIAVFEYDRLYVVVIVPGQQPVTTMLRFGEPYVEGRDFGLRGTFSRAVPQMPLPVGR